MKLVGISFAEFQACHLLLCIALALSFNQVSTTNETDRFVLLQFKAGIIKDPFGVLNSWNNSIGLCQWYGVTCGRRHRRVTVLDLSSQGLSGSISPHIGNLSFIRELLLQNNSFDHEIPPQVSQLRRLRILGLHNNSLIGEIPKNISECLDLVMLSLGNNQLIGEIPGDLGSLLKLQRLNLYANNLTGSVPSSIGNLSSLEILYLTRNNLGGSIPQVLGHLSNLHLLGIGFNRLSGTIPSSLLNLSSLIMFDVARNQIQGTLPAGIVHKLLDLEFFSVTENQLEGPIPLSISNCTKLDVLQIGSNKFSGKVPSWENLFKLGRFQIFGNQLGSGKPEDLNFLCSLTNSTKLEYVSIGKNKFGGVLPKCLGNLSTTLKAFSATMNQISGDLPKEIGNIVNLEVLFMNLNHLSGVIPSNFANLQNLRILQVSDNNLGGVIPYFFGNLTKLIELYIGGNNFHGNIPSYLSNCQLLDLFDLSNNNLSGVIPPQLIGHLSLAIILDLSHNHLTGVLPIEVGNLRNLTVLDISDNLLVGEIPSSLGDCIALTSLRMGGNFFQGSIPQSIRLLEGIEELDLSRNNLSGQIPEFLTIFRSLKLLNLSHNKFEGMLPREGVFKNATATSIVGNNGLCGSMPEFHLPNCISKSFKSTRINIIIFFAFVIPGVLGMFLNATLIYLFRVKKNVNVPISSFFDDVYPKISYETLLKATRGFASTNLIGFGSYGSVYKGILQDNGTFVAVKVLHLARRGALNSLMVECEASKNIRHRNILKMLKVCSSKDHQGNHFKALVYEYMANGSLKCWLHPYTSLSHGNELSKKLNFIWRINIAIDIAYALDYLHHQCPIPIVHCDLKPSNILLDAEMVAHVGDFGLAKFLDGLTNQMSSMARGTTGYIPPEYGMGCKASRKGDVYSYGILLLELFTGLSPTGHKFGDNLTLHNFVLEALPERVLEITDIFLLQEKEDSSCYLFYEREEIFRKCLLMVYKIGVACSSQVPQRRISISKVPHLLHQIRDELLAWVDMNKRFFLDDSYPKISYETLLKATRCFSSTNLIGVGGYGSVYKGILQANGRLVAVKVLHLAHQGALNSLMVECEVSKNIKQRNILKILTVCSSKDHQGNHFKALVYEYMANGSLKRWLHPCTTSSHGNEILKKLNFIRRINIAIDIAYALDYLHHQCPIPIVHCDLKPSNILLDAEMVAHVGDFGLAKFLDDLTNQMSSMARGTTGYIPPEYGMGCKASRKGDVYSYGILLLELFTGLSPTSHKFGDNLTLNNFVAEALPERVLEITDIFLLQEKDGSSWHLFYKGEEIFQKCLLMVYKIGVACSSQEPLRRISISEVPHLLHQIRDELVGWVYMNKRNHR